MSSVLSSSPVILSALLMTDAMEAPVLVGVEVAMGAGRDGSAVLAGGFSGFCGAAWGCAAWAGCWALASLGLSPRLKRFIRVSPEVGRVCQNSWSAATAF